MGIIDWLHKNASGDSERLPAGSSIPLLTENGEKRGVVLVHSDETRDAFIRELTSATDVAPHRGAIASYFVDLLGSASPLINAAIQSRQLLQIVGTPEIVAGIQNGSLSIMRSGGQMTGTVVSNATQKIVGQLRFEPANIAGIVGPLAVWQILNAVAGVYHLQKIDTKLASLQRGIDRLTLRTQAKTYGQLMSAVAILQELSKQHAITGTFSSDMMVKLALAERDIRSAWSEQHLLMERFKGIINQILHKKGDRGAVQAILKEESNEFFRDMKLLIDASRASILVSEAWIQYDLEHNPRYVSVRLHDSKEEVKAIESAISQLAMLLDELQKHAVDRPAETNWFRDIFAPIYKDETTLSSQLTMLLDEFQKRVTEMDKFIRGNFAWMYKDETALSSKITMLLDELQKSTVDCLEEMDWFSRNILNQPLKSGIVTRVLPRKQEKTQPNTRMPSIVIWKDHNNVTKSVIIDVAVEE